MNNLMYVQGMTQQSTTNMPMQVVVLEPYVYGALQGLVGKRVVIETSRGRVTGKVLDAKPDHVAIQDYDSTFFVRLCEIVWVMPDN